MFDVQDLASESSLESQRNRKRAVKLISIVIATFAGAFFTTTFAWFSTSKKTDSANSAKYRKPATTEILIAEEF